MSVVDSLQAANTETGKYMYIKGFVFHEYSEIFWHFFVKIKHVSNCLKDLYNMFVLWFNVTVNKFAVILAQTHGC